MYTYGKKHSTMQGTFALLTELGSRAIHVIDLEGKIRLKHRGPEIASRATFTAEWFWPATGGHSVNSSEATCDTFASLSCTS